MPRYTVTPDVPLRVRFDADERLAKVRPELTVKGMFFGRLVGGLGDEWKKHAATLASAPRLGTYMPFSDYPFVDYQRLTIAVAKKRYPNLVLGEAIRVLERETVRAFADSTVGKVMLKMASDLRAAMLKVPEIQKMVVKNGRAVATALGERSVRLEFREMNSWLDCALIGNLEGAVVMYGEKPTIDVDLIDEDNVSYDVHW